MQITADSIAKELGGKPILSGEGGWLCKCVAHTDKKASLKVSDGTTKQPIVVHCKSGCSQKDVIDKLKARGLWPKKGKPQKDKKVDERTCVAVYVYPDENGDFVCRKLRYEPKDFFQEHFNPEKGWVKGFPKTLEPPLYQAPLLKKARECGGTVYLCEGEKDVDHLLAASAAFVTTNFDGASTKWRDSWTRQLEGCRIVMLPDNDAAGELYVSVVAPQLQAAGLSVKVIRLPGLEKKGDVTDWLKKCGGTLKKLEQLVEDASEWNPEDPFALEGTEFSAKESLVRLYGKDLRHTEERGWMVWDGKRYKMSGKDAKKIAEKALMRLQNYSLAQKMQTSRGRRNVLDLAESNLGSDINDFDAQPDLINCLNGVLDLRTGELRSHEESRDLMLSKLAAAKFDMTAKCPIWDAFLKRAMDNDEEMIQYLQRAVGYTLTGLATEQVLFFCHGFGKNGKSVFIETIKAMMGDYSCAISKNSLMLQDRNSAIRNDIARLVQTRFVAVSETTQGEWLDEGMVKDLTGKDTIGGARFLRKEYFDFKPQFKLWMRGNYKPEIRGQDHGIWRRIHLIPFEVQIDEKENDKTLDSKLLAELPGIFAWAVVGCFNWREFGLMPPQKVCDAVKEYKEEMDLIGRFIFENYLINTPFEAKASEVYQVYRKWCEMNGQKPLTLTRFGRAIRQHGIKTGTDRRNCITYIGLELKGEDNE